MFSGGSKGNIGKKRVNPSPLNILKTAILQVMSLKKIQEIIIKIKNNIQIYYAYFKRDKIIVIYSSIFTKFKRQFIEIYKFKIKH